MSTVLRSVGRVVQLHQQRMSAGFSAFRLNGAQLNVSRSTHLLGCGVGLASAALPLALPLPLATLRLPSVPPILSLLASRRTRTCPGKNSSDDPLLNIDWFDMSQPTFRPHPHAGFSAVTYLLPGSPGSFMNRDSRGNKEPIHPGDVHWTTAGSGVVHEEVPVQAGVSCQGLQIFVNLPPQLKSVEPRADHLSSDAIPLYSSPDNAKVRVIAGSVGGVTSPLQLVYPVTLLHVQLPQGSSLQHKVPPGHTVLLLVLEGEVRVAQGLPAAPSSWTHLPYASAADMQGEGEAVQLHGPAEGSEASSGQVLLFSGQPIGAPVVWRGPFCGNSTAEVERWGRAYQAGSMGSLEASF